MARKNRCSSRHGKRKLTPHIGTSTLPRQKRKKGGREGSDDRNEERLTNARGKKEKKKKEKPKKEKLSVASSLPRMALGTEHGSRCRWWARSAHKGLGQT
jgi:hypothetical protein